MSKRALRRHGDFGGFGHDVAVARPAHVWTKDHLGRFNELAAMAAMPSGKSASPVGVVLGLAGLGLLGAAVYYAMKAPALPAGGKLPATSALSGSVTAAAVSARPAAPAVTKPPATTAPRVPTPAQAAPHAFSAAPAPGMSAADVASAAASSQSQANQDAWNAATAASYATMVASAPAGTVFANPDGTIGPQPVAPLSVGTVTGNDTVTSNTGGTAADPNVYTSVTTVPDPAPADDGGILGTVAGIFS